MTIVTRLNNGETASKLAREYNVNESTIRNIRKREATIRATAEILTPEGARKSLRHRNLRMAKMEACTLTWLDDMRAKRLPFWYAQVRAKAFQLYKEIGSMSYEDDVAFMASKGWYCRFKKKYKLSDVRPSEDDAPPSEAAFKRTLMKTIATQKLTRDQIFMAERTTFWWKRFPGLLGEESASLMVCTNASGNVFLQPVLFSDKVSTNPHIVLLQAERSGSMTAEHFLDWFRDHFIQQCRDVNDQHRKTLLVLASDRTYPKEINHSSVNVVLVPPECNSSLFPAAQGILDHLNASYLLQLALKLIHDVNCGKPLEKAWMQFSIDDALQLLENAIDQMDQSAIAEPWANLLDDIPAKFSNQHILEEIVLTAQSLGLNGVTEEQVCNLIIPRALSNEETIELYHKRHSEAAMSCDQLAADDDQLHLESRSNSPEAPLSAEMEADASPELVEEINRHVTALLDARKFVEKHDPTKVRAEAISKRLRQVCLWMTQMKKEMQTSEELEPVEIVEVKQEDPLGFESDDEWD